MSYPISVKKNNYFENRKNSTVETPRGVSEFIYGLIHNNTNIETVIDVCCGRGALSKPFYKNNYLVYGIDIEDPKIDNTYFIFSGGDFLYDEIKWFVQGGKLILCNPPFNDRLGKYKKKLLPELFLNRIFETFGYTTPVVLFVPMGFRLNQRKKSKRWKKLRDSGAEITTIITLPIDIFKDVLFHSEILIFNIQGLKPHYFLPEEAL